MTETRDERCRRWFVHGMNDQERIEYLNDWVDRLIKENAELRTKLNDTKRKT